MVIYTMYKNNENFAVHGHMNGFYPLKAIMFKLSFTNHSWFKEWDLSAVTSEVRMLAMSVVMK